MNRAELDIRVEELAKQAKLESWNSFVEELKVPSELYPALVTNRPELIRLAKERPLTAEECGNLYRLIAGLLETNSALRQHASQVSALVSDWMNAIGGMVSTAEKVERFAGFRHQEVAE